MDRCFRRMVINWAEKNKLRYLLKQCGSIKYDIVYLLYIYGFLVIEARACEKREIMLTSVLVFT